MENSIIWKDIILYFSTSMVGAIAGGYMVYKLQIRREDKIRKSVRKIATDALDIIKKYKGKYFSDAENEFNNTVNITNKRIIIVLLSKLGIPITFDKKTVFDIKHIKFLSKEVDISELNDITNQINTGNCDNLFFIDPEQYFSNNFIIKYKRELAKKYVDNVFSNSIILDEKIHHPDKWTEKFTQREVDILQIFSEKLCFARYYDESTKKPRVEFVDELHKEIDIGLWDDYLNWSYDIYSNVQMQSRWAKLNIEYLHNQSKKG